MRTKLSLLLLAILAGVNVLFAASGICGKNLQWSYNTSTKTLTITGHGAMADYTNSVAPWYSYRNQILIVNFPDGITSIGDKAFYDCTGLTTIEIPNSVTSIGKHAFYDCAGLTSVTIPNSVTSIGTGAFGYCTGLTSITIPNSVTSIGESVFVGCSGLLSITIPNSVTSIGSYAFYWCTGLNSVTIPNSVISIGSGAFSECSSLTSIEIPNSVTSIGEFAFSDCSGLTAVTIPNSVTSIGEAAFQVCNNLTSITIPNSVTNIGDYAFACCYGLSSIICWSIVPILLSSNTFREVDKSIPLYVPCEAIDAYKQAEQWNDFENIYAIGYVDYSYSVTSADENQGMVTITDEKIDCEKTISFRAEANEGYQFKQWSDGNIDNPRTIVLTQNTTLTAIFEPKSPTDLEEIEETIQLQKILKDNHIFILRSDHIFDTQGKMVR